MDLYGIPGADWRQLYHLRTWTIAGAFVYRNQRYLSPQIP